MTKLDNIIDFFLAFLGIFARFFLIASDNADSSDFDKNRNKINLHEVQQPQEAS